MIQDVPDLDFFTRRGQKGTGSRIRISNTGCKLDPCSENINGLKSQNFYSEYVGNKNEFVENFLFNLDLLYCVILLYYFLGMHNGPYMLHVMFIGWTVKANLGLLLYCCIVCCVYRTDVIVFI
jgi:hypothetical protein